jgi:hypothetical protein
MDVVAINALLVRPVVQVLVRMSLHVEQQPMEQGALQMQLVQADSVILHTLVFVPPVILVFVVVRLTNVKVATVAVEL